MDEDLDYTFYNADGHTICVAQNDEIQIGVSLPTSENTCTDRVKLIAMVHDQRARLIAKENS